MVAEEETRGILLDAESLIDAREYSTALWRLRLAAANVRTDDANAAWIFERIRDAAASVAWSDPRYERDAQAVWDIVVKREAEIEDRPQTPRQFPTRPPADAGWAARAVVGESWVRAAETVADLAIIASILSFALGIGLGVEVSRYTNSYGETRHHVTVVLFWIVVGLFAALAWVGMAAGLRVLAFIGRSQGTGPATS